MLSGFPGAPDGGRVAFAAATIATGDEDEDVGGSDVKNPVEGEEEEGLKATTTAATTLTQRGMSTSSKRGGNDVRKARGRCGALF